MNAGRLGMAGFRSLVAPVAWVSLCVQFSWSVVEWMLVCLSEVVGLAMSLEMREQDPNPQEPASWATC